MAKHSKEISRASIENRLRVTEEQLKKIEDVKSHAQRAEDEMHPKVYAAMIGGYDIEIQNLQKTKGVYEEVLRQFS